MKIMPDFNFEPINGIRPHDQLYKDPNEEDDVFNSITRVHKLTRGKLKKQEDWEDWQNSEYLQLDQYEKQYMF